MRSELNAVQLRAGEMIRQDNILMTDDEQGRIRARISVSAVFLREGAQILTFVETARIGVNAIILFSHQTLPEHCPPVGVEPCQKKSFRMIAGTLYFYTPGEDALQEGFIPKRIFAMWEKSCSVRQEIYDASSRTKRDRKSFEEGIRSAKS